MRTQFDIGTEAVADIEHDRQHWRAAWLRLSPEAREAWLARADETVEALKGRHKPWVISIEYSGAGRGRVTLWRDGTTKDGGEVGLAEGKR